MSNNLDLFFVTNNDKFKPEHLAALRTLCKDKEDVSFLYGVSLKSPITMFIISWFLGTYGVDRFMLKDIKAGVAKVAVFILFFILYIALIFSAAIASENNNYDYFGGGLIFITVILCLTAIIIFVFWLYDLCTVIRRTKEYNFMKMCEVLNLTNVNISVSQNNPTITTVSKTVSETVSDKNIADNE